MNKIKICKVCGREVSKLKLGMCRKHYEQYHKYGKVLDNNQDLIRKYNIRSIPTLIFLNEDKEYNRLVGNQSYAIINKIINYDTI